MSPSSLLFLPHSLDQKNWIKRCFIFLFLVLDLLDHVILIFDSSHILDFHSFVLSSNSSLNLRWSQVLRQLIESLIFSRIDLPEILQVHLIKCLQVIIRHNPSHNLLNLPIQLEHLFLSVLQFNLFSKQFVLDFVSLPFHF